MYTYINNPTTKYSFNGTIVKICVIPISRYNCLYIFVLHKYSPPPHLVNFKLKCTVILYSWILAKTSPVILKWESRSIKKHFFSLFTLVGKTKQQPKLDLMHPVTIGSLIISWVSNKVSCDLNINTFVPGRFRVHLSLQPDEDQGAFKICTKVWKSIKSIIKNMRPTERQMLEYDQGLRFTDLLLFYIHVR